MTSKRLLGSIPFCFLLASLCIANEAEAKPRGIAALVDNTHVAIRPWSVQTSIETPYFVNSEDPSVWADPARPVLPSPDGRMFAVVTRQGNLKADENVYELRVFETSAVISALRDGARIPPPLYSTKKNSLRGAEGAIFDLRWSDDKRITFLSAEGAVPYDLGKDRAIFEINLLTKKLHRLCTCSRKPSGPINYLVASTETGATYYVDYASPAVAVSHELAYVGEFITPDVVYRLNAAHISDGNLSIAYRDAANEHRRVALYVSFSGSVTKLRDLGEQGDFAGGGEALEALPAGSFSPDGAVGVFAIAGRFERFDPISREFQTLASSGRSTAIGKSSSLRPNVSWVEGGRVAILANAKLPGSNSAWIAAYDASSGKVVPVSELEKNGQVADSTSWFGRTIGIRWQSNVRTDAENEGTWRYYELKDGKWQETVSSPKVRRLSWSQPNRQTDFQIKLSKKNGIVANGTRIIMTGSWMTYPAPMPLRFANGLELTLSEAPSTPQKLVATLGKKSIVLVDTMPHFIGTRILPSSIFEWKTSDGRLHRGMLTSPTNRARPVPLVVQLYSYTPNVFRPDGGQGFSGYARQALAARGMAVLDVDIGDCIDFISKSRVSTRIEGATRIDCEKNLLQSAISVLDRSGIIDSARLGVQGFSSGGFSARQALLHPGVYKFLAAAANDSWNASLLQNRMELFLSGVNHAESVYYNGGLFRDNPKKWMENSIDLGGEKATGALLEVQHSEVQSLLYDPFLLMWGGAAEAHRPIEYLQIPNAGHSIQGPRQRYTSLSNNVDWMDFWLNDRERTIPNTDANETTEMLTEKYARWREMKKDWARQQAWEAAGHPAGSDPDPK